MQLEVNEINKVFSPIKEALESSLEERRDLRDQLNAKVRAYLDTRNEVNRQVKELISEVRSQKDIRDVANTKVKELKLDRAEKSNELKLIRTELREILSKLEESGDSASRRSGPLLHQKLKQKWMLWKENTREVDSRGQARRGSLER